MRRFHATTCQIQALEPRLLLAATPGEVITKANRQTLLNNMTLSASLKASLQSKLSGNDLAGFDQQLLDYTRNRAGKYFFFESDQVSSYVTYINANLSTADVFNHANPILANLYPEQGSSSTYNVSIPDDIDWDYTGYSSNPETIHALNWHSHWVDLAMAYRLSGNGAYADKLFGQLADWSQENPPLADPETWRQNNPRWWLLDTSIRAESWAWTYMLLLDSPKWSKEANSLFLFKTLEHGQFLRAVTPEPLTLNHALVHAQGLLFISNLFPEFTGAGAWEAYARDLLFDCMDAQLFADGSHFEQSPGYASTILERLIESRKLDSTTGVAWPADRTTKLTKGINAYYQFLSPDGNAPAIGDTYRTSTATLYLKSNLTLGVTTWPAGKPRVRDVWLFGPAAVDPYRGNPANPPLGSRPKTYALPDSGNYIARSGSDADARQVIFDAGPKGGSHGHLDLLNFELFGYGAPLIADPGLYRYDNSANRKWVVSTPAHNTISVDGKSHNPLESIRKVDFKVDQWVADASHVQVTASHFGYAYLSGRPVVSRSLWYDLDGTIVILDWAEAVESHQFTTSFTIPGTSVTSDLANGRIQSTNAGGNVKIQSLLRAGQTAARENRFTSSQAPPDHVDSATRYLVSQTGTFACFATVISAYDGPAAPNVTAQWLTTPTPGARVKIRLFKNGVAQDIAFVPPPLQRLGPRAASSGSFCDIAFDSTGRLHHVFFDRTSQTLKYTARSPVTGKWSIAQTIDGTVGSGLDPSIAVDGNNHVGVAYTKGSTQDLLYAFNDGMQWTIQAVDSAGATGLYPSLAFSRRNGPVVTYYDKSKGDLRMATSAGHGFTLTTLDSGTIGTKDVGKYSHLVLDPSRPTVTKWAIVYEDTSGGRYRYAIEGTRPGGEQKNAYTFFEIDTTVTRLGGFLSLAFDRANRPTVSYYDSLNSALKFARSSGDTFTGIRFTASFVATEGLVGYYSNLYYDAVGKANILYFDRTNNRAMRARNTSGSTWTITTLGAGGREFHSAFFAGRVAFTNLNEDAGSLEVVY